MQDLLVCACVHHSDAQRSVLDLSRSQKRAENVNVGQNHRYSDVTLPYLT